MVYSHTVGYEGADTVNKTNEREPEFVTVQIKDRKYG